MHSTLKKMAIIIALTSISTAQAKLYSWVDEDGKTHFSDRKSAEMYSGETVSEVDVKVSSSDLTLGVKPREPKQKEEFKAAVEQEKPPVKTEKKSPPVNTTN